MNKKYVIGIDFGTDSCRALVVDVSNGEEQSSSVKYYPRWKDRKYCDPQNNQYRQHPLDYVESMEAAINEALKKAENVNSSNVIGLSFDMTGSTPVLTDKKGTPLALLNEFADNPNAMFVLWKDHTAINEAEQINELARKWDIDYTAYEGGVYSSEWVWAKMLHILKEDEKVRESAYSWIEHADWMPALLTGNMKPESVIRSRCAAGHKAMWHDKWGGLPSEEFLTELSPVFKNFRSHLYSETYPSNKKVGNLTQEWADRLSLSTNVVVGVSALDCHMGAVGAGIKPGAFVRVIGTSTCDIMVVPYDQMEDKLIPGICGQVDGSVIPGMIGLEAGQSAFGDLYAWFKQLLEWPINNILSQSSLLDTSIKEKMIEEVSAKIIPELTIEAEKISMEDSFVIATDWMNGRRTPNANQRLTGTIAGLTLGTSAPMIYRALVEATAYGSKAIIEQIINNGIEINEVIGIGGISQKSPFVMQIMSDVLNMPIKICASEQACALGSAMFAAVVAGEYKTIEEAQEFMGQNFMKEYLPNTENVKRYKKLYYKYQQLGNFTETSMS